MKKVMEIYNKNLIKTLLNRFRVWNLDWEIYDHDVKNNKPKSLEDFIKELEKEFNINE